MRIAVCIAVLAWVPTLLGSADTVSPKIDANLVNEWSVATEADYTSALVCLADAVDVASLDRDLSRSRATLARRHETVVTALRDRASSTQGGLLDQLAKMVATGEVRSFQPIWVANCIRVDGRPAALRQIAERADVSHVYLNYEIELIAPVPSDKSAPTVPATRTPAIGLQAVRAPEVWAQGFTGQGVLIATLDTGVDGNHPALASRWRGVADPRYAGHPEWAWFDPVTNTTFPQSFGAHGTHTMGTVCGGAPGEEVGMAPGAQWIHAAVIDRVSIPQTVADALLAFQWLIDPDGNATTNWDVPAVCSNSWRVRTSHGYAPCDATFWVSLDACEAAGIVIVFAAGNEGPSTETVGRPSDRATDAFRTCAIGAIDANTTGWPIADFSSRGPCHCTPDGSAAIKPELVAPGVGVRSSVPGGGYESSGWDGTSMATPHVCGAIALIREACPDLSVQEVKEVLYETAVDLGPPGEDNDYGLGIIDVYEAVQLALSMCSGAPRARNANVQCPVGAYVSIALEATDYDHLPDPPAALTFIVTSLPQTGNTLTDMGNGHVIVPGDLPYSLVNYGNDVLYTPAPGYYGQDGFEFKANDGGVPPDGGDSNLATVSVLVLYDPPQITTSSLPPGTLNGLYTPVTMQASDGQPPLSWIVVPAQNYLESDLGSSLFATVGTAQGWHADDASWPYTLPFAFSFYDVDYTTIYVSSNGYLNMDGPASDYSNSDAALKSHVRIAAMYDDLSTDSAYDIYIQDTVPGEVTFRWAARTYSGSYPVNFSIVLYADGRIRFHYGSGNTGMTATIGLSAGDNVRYTLSSYNNAASLTNANSLEYVLPSTLPAGMSLSPAGVLSGIPTEAGSFSPIFRVTDALNRSDDRQIPLQVNIGPIPPIAYDGSAAMLANAATTLTLVGTDDGLPNPPGVLSYVIASLPAHGSLADPGAGAIGTVPYTLVNHGNAVVYTPGWWYSGADGFTFKANDGGTPPAGGDSNVASVSLQIDLPAPQRVASFTLDVSPGWATEGQWAFGAPMGGGSHNLDPTAGFTGTNVYGYNLAGDYARNLSVKHLTTQTFDSRYWVNTELRFWRWLGVEAWDTAAVQASSAGSPWTTLWSNATVTVADSSWVPMIFDVSDIADGHANLAIRWAMGPTDGTVTYPGWNIDDIELWAVVTSAPPTVCRGDCNCDGGVGFADIDFFVASIPNNETAWRAKFAPGAPSCGFANCDVNGNGNVGFDDIDPFVGKIPSACPH